MIRHMDFMDGRTGLEIEGRHLHHKTCIRLFGHHSLKSTEKEEAELDDEHNRYHKNSHLSQCENGLLRVFGCLPFEKCPN